MTRANFLGFSDDAKAAGLKVSGSESEPELSGSESKIRAFLAKQWNMNAGSDDISELFEAAMKK